MGVRVEQIAEKTNGGMGVENPGGAKSGGIWSNRDFMVLHVKLQNINMMHSTHL